MCPEPTPADVLAFWFETTPPRLWFAKHPDFDAEVRRRFLPLTESALDGERTCWAGSPEGNLALVLLLDQMPRQLWRDQPRAFAGDGPALELSLEAERRGWLAAEPRRARRQFWLMPRMHSENLAVQEAALPLFERWTDARTLDFARRHRDVIARFGRFPHRNAALGRTSTLAERQFLQEPGSRF